MTRDETLFIGNKMKGAEQSQMFGKPCFPPGASGIQGKTR